MEEAHGHHIPCGTVCGTILSAWVEDWEGGGLFLGSTESALQAVVYIAKQDSTDFRWHHGTSFLTDLKAELWIVPYVMLHVSSQTAETRKRN